MSGSLCSGIRSRWSYIATETLFFGGWLVLAIFLYCFSESGICAGKGKIDPICYSSSIFYATGRCLCHLYFFVLPEFACSFLSVLLPQPESVVEEEVYLTHFQAVFVAYYIFMAYTVMLMLRHLVGAIRSSLKGQKN